MRGGVAQGEVEMISATRSWGQAGWYRLRAVDTSSRYRSIDRVRVNLGVYM